MPKVKSKLTSNMSRKRSSQGEDGGQPLSMRRQGENSELPTSLNKIDERIQVGKRRISKNLRNRKILIHPEVNDLGNDSCIGDNNNALPEPYFLDGNTDVSNDGDEAIDSLDHIVTTVDRSQIDEEFPDEVETETDSDDSSGRIGGCVSNSPENEVSFKTPEQAKQMLANVGPSQKGINFGTPKRDSNFRTGLISGEEGESTGFDTLREDPAFSKYIKNLVAQELKAERSKKSREPQKEKPKSKLQGEFVKSPSDTALYALALNKIAVVDKTKQIVNNLLGEEIWRDPEPDISKFIEGIRIKNQNRNRVVMDDAQPSTSRGHNMEGTGDCGVLEDPDVQTAKRKADKMILDAERFKATVNVPPGGILNTFVNTNNVAALPEQNFNVGSGQFLVNTQLPNVVLEDDEFFHVTCHVDQSIRSNLEHGNFSDLERLLPKQRYSGDENRLQLVQKEGVAYFVPAQGNNRINSIRKWEQAFCIYAAIYSQANPARAAEIWQYVHVINIAATTYTWENVYYYDVTFRQMMVQKSFAKLGQDLHSNVASGNERTHS